MLSRNRDGHGVCIELDRIIAACGRRPSLGIGFLAKLANLFAGLEKFFAISHNVFIMPVLCGDGKKNRMDDK